MKKLLKMLVVVLSIALCASVTACKPIDDSTDSGNNVPSLTVVLSGRVMHGEQPIEGVTVTATDSRGNAYGTVTTATDGKFEFTEVAKTRAVSVTFEKNGYFTKTVELSISDIAAGKNVMGDIQLEAPESFRNLKGKVVAIDGTSGVAGVSVSVKGFDISATSGSDGTFTLANVPVSTEGTVLTTSKALYGEVENVITGNQIAEDGDIGNIYSYIVMPAIDGSTESKLSVVRGDSSIKVLMQLSKNIGGGQNIQVSFHVGDNASGKLYTTMLFADANHGITGADFENRDHIPFERSIALGVDSYTAISDEIFPTTYTYSAEDQNLCYEVPYSSLGITADDTVGFCVMNVVVSGAGGWVSPSFGVDMPTNGSNALINYTNMYDLTATGEFVARDISNATVSGIVKNEAGEPIEGVSLTAKDASGKTYESVLSANDGTFSISVGRLYGITVEVTKAQYSSTSIKVSLEELFDESVEKEITLKELAGIATLKGSVKNLLGGKIAGVKVEVKGMDVSVLTNDNGEFNLVDAPIGTEGATLVFSAVGYTTIEKNIQVTQLSFNDVNDLGEIEMYSEFGGDGHTKFSVVRESTGLRFKFVTDVSFQTAEIYYVEILVGTNVYCFCLLPNDSVNAAAIGTYHGRYTRATEGDNIDFGAIEEVGDTWTVKNTGAGANEADWFVPYTEINMQEGDEFGLCIVAVLFQNYPNCIPFGYDMQPTIGTFVTPRHFYIVGMKNEYTIA